MTLSFNQEKNMIFKRRKNRTRVVPINDGQCYETFSGEKLPIMQAPMVFTDLYKEFLEKNDEVVKLEKERREFAIKNEDFDYDEYAKVANQYIELAYDIIKTVIEFQGYEIDIEWIKNNFTQDDMVFYLYSVNLKRPVYTIEDLIEKKSK